MKPPKILKFLQLLTHCPAEAPSCNLQPALRPAKTTPLESGNQSLALRLTSRNKELDKNINSKLISLTKPSSVYTYLLLRPPDGSLTQSLAMCPTAWQLKHLMSPLLLKPSATFFPPVKPSRE